MSKVMPEYRLPIRVYIEDTDAGGIVYYVNYLKYFERARTELIRSLGVDKTAVMEDGSVFVVTSAAIDYHAPARLDDQLEAVAEVVGSGAATIEFRQSVLRSGIELASGQVRVALTDGSSGKPKRMPKVLRELLTQST
jgi:tol-pal system-associated acyl-CoA thioesterase